MSSSHSHYQTVNEINCVFRYRKQNVQGDLDKKKKNWTGDSAHHYKQFTSKNARSKMNSRQNSLFRNSSTKNFTMAFLLLLIVGGVEGNK